MSAAPEHTHPRPACGQCASTGRGRRMHCPSPTCTWWLCHDCGAINDVLHPALWMPGNGRARPAAGA